MVRSRVFSRLASAICATKPRAITSERQLPGLALVLSAASMRGCPRPFPRQTRGATDAPQL
eukprot:4118610-Alexandrium_andersonii.AAC.1